MENVMHRNLAGEAMRTTRAALRRHPGYSATQRAAKAEFPGGSARPVAFRDVAARFFFDCEFIEDGTTIDLVSIGVVAETGEEFYAVSTQFDPDRAIPWVRRNVLDKLPRPSDSAWRSRQRIRDDLLAFLTETAQGERIELWAWYAAYDHVALCQLWGDMRALPQQLPRFTRDLRQRWEDLGEPELPPTDVDQHDALADARHNLARWKAMESYRAGRFWIGSR
jgi:hypothetical protein